MRASGRDYDLSTASRDHGEVGAGSGNMYCSMDGPIEERSWGRVQRTSARRRGEVEADIRTRVLEKGPCVGWEM